MKNGICTVFGVIGGAISYAVGGWSQAMMTLIIFMAIDYISGLIVAGVFKKSTKTKTGALESRTGFKGICRKFMMIVFVVIGHRTDLLLGSTYIRDTVAIAFIVNELISIVENAGLMGIPIPAVISNAIDVLKKDNEKEG